MEIFNGQYNTLILYDDSPFSRIKMKQSLHSFSASREYDKENKTIVLDLSEIPKENQKETIEEVKKNSARQIFIYSKEEVPEQLYNIDHQLLLYKGERSSAVGQYILSLQKRKHRTWVEYDLKAIERNIQSIKKNIPKETLLLVMVKAASYGTGDVRIPHFLQQIGIDYFGVAFVDEGVILRKSGIKRPIFVINTEKESFKELVKHDLEPAIATKEQLDDFVGFLRNKKIKNYPIHIATETGMHRLGIEYEEVDDWIENLQSTPEIQLKGVYSHLADADNHSSDYTEEQFRQFALFKTKFEEAFGSSVLFHILNTEGTLRYGKTAGFDMVRVGIGIYGYCSISEEKGLIPSMRWQTTITQIKTILPGQTIGYGRTFKAEEKMKIATLPLGYADGFSRQLSNGQGKVAIHGQLCPVVGNVCMDMLMIDVSNVACHPGDVVEIIGDTITMELFSEYRKTIPYEVMTSIDKRVAKIYLK